MNKRSAKLNEYLNNIQGFTYDIDMFHAYNISCKFRNFTLDETTQKSHEVI